MIKALFKWLLGTDLMRGQHDRLVSADAYTASFGMVSVLWIACGSPCVIETSDISRAFHLFAYDGADVTAAEWREDRHAQEDRTCWN